MKYFRVIKTSGLLKISALQKALHQPFRTKTDALSQGHQMLKPTSPSNTKKRDKCQASSIHMEWQKTENFYRNISAHFSKCFQAEDVSKFWPSFRGRHHRRGLWVQTFSPPEQFLCKIQPIHKARATMTEQKIPSFCGLPWSMFSIIKSHFFYLSYIPKANISFYYIQTTNGWERRYWNPNEPYNRKL